MNTTHNRRKLTLGIVLVFSILIIATCGMQGCKRSYYRHKADAEAYALIRTATNDPRWELKDFSIRTDRDARFHDPYDPDCEPMPLDDPTAAGLMECVDGKRGSQVWKKYGKTEYMDNPYWRAGLSLDESGTLYLDKETAVRLALKHSPAYQEALEELYLAALDVSTQRYVFDTQFFGGNSLFYTSDGTPRSTMENDLTFGLNRTFATGANLAVDLANSMTWQFTGRDTFSPQTSFSFSLLQPLLRGGGRAVALESLTQAERNFLAEVRNLAYFQQGFYVASVVGGSGAAGAGGVGGGYYALLSSQVQIENRRQNITLLEDTLSRGIQFFLAGRENTRQIDIDETRMNLLDSQSVFLQEKGRFEGSIENYLVNFLGLPPDIPVEVSDPLLEQFELMSPSLQKLQAETKELLASLRSANRPIPENLDEILPALAQRLAQGMEVVEKDLVNLERAVPERIENLRVLAAQESIRNGEVLPSISSIEDFEKRVQDRREAIPNRKQRVALVVQLCDLFNRYDKEEFLEQFDREAFDEATFEALYRLNLLALVPVLEMEVRAIEKERFSQTLDDLTNLRRGLQTQLNVIETNLLNSDRYVDEPMHQRRRELTAEIRGVLERIAEIETQRDEFITERIGKWVRGDRSLSFSEDDFDTVKGRLREDEIHLQQEREARLATRRALVDEEFPLFRRPDTYRNLVSRIAECLGTEVGDLLTDQAETRLDSIPLKPVDITVEDAFAIAAENRLDWMNRKARLVDTWRQIELRADDLKGVLDLSVSGSLDTSGNNMAKFDKRTGQVTVGLRWDSPLSRLNEQNAYRAALIEYQRARRDYYTYVDAIKAGLRDSVRNIKIDQLNFEIQRGSVFIAIASVDNANMNLEDPTNMSDNATRDVLQSLEGLLTSQNSFMNNWVNYLGRRMQLELDTGTLRLDEEGMWIDSGSSFGPDRSRTPSGDPAPTLVPAPIPVPVPGRSQTE